MSLVVAVVFKSRPPPAFRGRMWLLLEWVCCCLGCVAVACLCRMMMADVAFVSRSCAFSVLDEISKVCNFHGFCCTEPITFKFGEKAELRTRDLAAPQRPVS